jgi:subtilisin
VSRRLFVPFCVAAAAFVVAAPAQAERIPGQYIVVLRDESRSASVAAAHARSANAAVLHVYGHALNGYAARLSAAGLAAVRSDPRVLFVAQDREVNAVAQTLPTGLNRIEADLSSQVSGNGTGSAPVNVAVLDTGIDVDHPDLNVVGGTNCSTGSGYDDGNGHGTHVAGTIGARDDAQGVVGVVPGAPLWAVRVLNNAGFGSWSSVACGVDWVTSTRTDADLGNDIVVANMSLGGSGADDRNCGNTNNDVLHRAICRSTGAGVTYVVAAGNSASDLKGFVPAAYNEVLATTATADFDGMPGGRGSPTCRSDQDDTYADFSNFATLAEDQAHTIAAPGVCILSTWKNGGYDTISGTSMASPHMAGTAALCIFAGSCSATNPRANIRKLRSDAESYNAARLDYGYVGDPFRPVTGRYFGFLTTADLY